MRAIKVLVHVYNKDLTYAENSYIRAEKVTRFGAHSLSINCYEPYADEEVTVYLKFKCWTTGVEVAEFFINRASLRVALERINLFPLNED